MAAMIKVSDEDITLLDRIAADQKLSREALVARAIHLLPTTVQGQGPLSRAAFGIWADVQEDGVAYQQRMREQWS